MSRWIAVTAFLLLMVTQVFAYGKQGPHGLSCKAFAGEFMQLTTKSGRPFQVYRTGPGSAGVGILLLPGTQGLDAAMLEWADRLGAEGYRVMAVNLTGKTRSTKSHPSHIIPQKEADALELATIHSLDAPGRKIITLGWGHAGALQSLRASAVDTADVAGTVLCDGGASAPGSLLKRVKSLVLLIAFHATTPLPQLQAFQARMQRYGKRLTVHYYSVSPTTADPAGPDFNSAIAQTIWASARSFFRQVKMLCRRCAPYPGAIFDYHN